MTATQWIAARLRDVLVTVTIATAIPVAYAEWVTVAKDREREVQLDLQTVLAAEAGVKVAWGRVLLAPDEAARLGFAAVRALNRFDCQRRTFTTVKRVYLDSDGLPLRDEAITNPEPTPVVKGSVDERLWRAVCQPTSPQALQQLAQETLTSTRTAMEPSKRKEATAPAAEPAQGAATATIPIGVELADVSQLPPEIAQQPVPNLLPVKPDAAKPDPPLPARQQNPVVSAGAPAASPGQSLPAARQSAPSKPPAASAAQPATASASPPKQHPASAAPPPASAPANVAVQTPPEPAKRQERAALSPRPSRPSGQWQFTGTHGPSAWHRLDPTWQQCRSGKRQSPIALSAAIAAAMAPPLWLVEPHWVSVTRTPQGLIVLQPQAPQRLLWRERLWHLEAASWHQPLLHPGRPGSYLGGWVLQWVSGSERLFVEIPVAASPRTAPELMRLAEHLQSGSSDLLLRWDWRSLLPGEERFFVYEGSEPWPPCREGVLWFLYKEGAEADPAAIAPLLAGPATTRPVQPRNGRPLFVVAD